MPRSAVVSVIMNCRNSSEFLREALDSVFAQTYKDWEIVFWDNLSTDESPAIALEYAGRKDGTLRYFRAETATPLGEARNLAIANAEGRYIAFLDCDDLWLPEKLERQVQLFENNSRLGLVCTDTIGFSGKRELSRMFEMAKPCRGMVFEQLVTAGWISMSAAVIRKDALDGLDTWFDPAFNVAEEADLFYRIAYDWELDYVDAPLTRWRVHGSNTTFAKFHQFAEETRLILRKHINLYPGYEQKYPQLVTLLKRRAAFQEAVALWRQGKNAEARKEISPWRDSLKFKAFWLATWMPGSLFESLARIYWALPRFLRV